MSDILTKSYLTGTPGTPGTEGTPAKPGYTTYTLSWVPIYSTPSYDPSTGTFVYAPWDPSAPGNSVGIGNGPPAGYVPAPPSLTGVPVLVTYQQVLTPINHPGVPATPGTPGTPPTLGEYNKGWNSGAISIASLSDPGEFSFSVPASAVGVVCGLSGTDANGGNYQKIQWGIYCHTGLFQVHENGNSVTAQLPYATSDVFAIVASGGVVSYYQNSTLIYTSTVAFSSPVAAYAAMFMGSDQVINAAFSAINPVLAPVTANCAGNLLGLQGFAADNSFGAGGWTNGGLNTLHGVSTSWAHGDVAGNLTPLTGWASDLLGEDSRGQLGGLSGHAEAGLLDPGYALVYGFLQPLQGFAYDGISYPGEVSGNLQGLSGFALAQGANSGGWQSSDNLGGLRGWSVQFSSVPNWFNGTITSGYFLVASGYSGAGSENYFRGTLTSHYGLVANAGALARMKLPVPTLLASGTVTTMGEAILRGPSCRLLATGSNVDIGRAYLATLGRYVVVGNFGAIARLSTNGGYGLTSHGLGGSLGEAVLRLRGYYPLLAHGAQGAYGLVAGNLNGLAMMPEGYARLIGPHFTIVAHGINGSPSLYEAYSHTLLGEKDAIDRVAVTHYTNYPFDRIVRFGAKYYGVGVTGMFELAGNLFDVAPVLSVVQTGETNFDEDGLKRMRRLYLNGRMAGNFGVSVIAREQETDSYTYQPVLGGVRSTRVPLGRGIQGQYFSFKLQNLDGQDFELEEMAPEVDVLRRTA